MIKMFSHNKNIIASLFHDEIPVMPAKSEISEKYFIMKTRQQHKNLLRTEMIGLTIASYLLIFHPHAHSSALIWSWFSSIVLVTTIRFWLATQYKKRFDASYKQAQRYEQFYYINVIAYGLLWGWAGILFVPFDQWQHQQ